MRILFLCHCFPYPPTKGDKIRAFHQLRHLSQRHEIHLLALGSQQEIETYRHELEELCRKVEGFPLNRGLARLRDPRLRGRVPRDRIACLWVGRAQIARLEREIRDFAAGLTPMRRSEPTPGPPPAPEMAVLETGDD